MSYPIIMMIRKATKSDSLPVAELMLLAMSDIVYAFLGTHDPHQALEFMHVLVQQEGNQYSFENTWVAEENRQIIGSITVYDGSELERLRIPVLHLLADGYGRVVFPENETEGGEMYIDTIAVHPEHQGKGLGTNLLNFVIDRIVYQEGTALGLLVDIDNTKAKNLYLQMGFEPIGEKKLMGHPYEHLQIAPGV